ncbi:helix-turn-helix transcriptional regulator [Rheinheimera oceanensis]|uniref:helix-turn-helix transcriptional regulator n=1 Tax=Rheinheimera oceanensis TaxID=2817449 RepID=UPI001BFDFD70|nr:helix-turn-helix domain-containing protein [Rheinheimera oceanensis]
MTEKNYDFELRDNTQLNNPNAAVEVMMYGNLNNKAVLNVAECSAFTGLSVSYIYKLTHTGKIPHSKPNGKLVFFDRRKIEEWLLSNPVETEADRTHFVAQKVNSLKLRS